MFTIYDAEKTRILSFISKQLTGKNIELEARLFRNNPIDYLSYHNILKKLIFSKNNNGYGLDYKTIERLDVISETNNYSNVRESIYEKSNIMLYSLHNKYIDSIRKKNANDVISVTKKQKEFIVLKNYSVKISIAEELENKKIILFSDNKSSKLFRYHQRISVFTSDKMFKFDFSSTKSGRGTTLFSSKTLNNYPIYSIEIEYIGKNITDKYKIFNNLMKNIAFIIAIKNNSSIFLSINDKKDILDRYKLLISSDENLKKRNRRKKNNNNLLGHKDFITAKPVTLHIENIKPGKNINILTNYGVTYKADGKNALLYIHTYDTKKKYGNVFIIDSMSKITPVGISIQEWEYSVIEGEYIEDKMIFCAYDMLFTKKIDIRNKPLVSFVENKTSRLSYLKDFIKDIPDDDVLSVKIIQKEYRSGNDNKIFEESKKLWNERKLQPYHIDGLIYTPLIEPYPTQTKSWNQLFKWKPPGLNSLDVLIEIIKGENKKDLLFPYTGSSDIKNYKKLNLYTTGITDKLNRKSGNIVRKSYPKLFKKINIPVDIKGNIYAKDPLSGNISRVLDDTIVEFIYDKTKIEDNNDDFCWIPIRTRYDKTIKYKNIKKSFGNGYNVAKDIVKSIHNPITVEIITTGVITTSNNNSAEITSEIKNVYYNSNLNNRKRLPYQLFHTTYVKKKLLEKASLKIKDSVRGSGYLIDFGVCRGGDLNRWIELDFKKIVGIDIDSKCITEAISRKQRNYANSNITFLCGDLSQLIFPDFDSACDNTRTSTGIIDWRDKMKQTMIQKFMFDIVSSQFVIHYFFSDELSLRIYLQNVSDNLKVGGHFVGSTFDGQRVYNSLKRKKFIEGKKDEKIIWKITKLYNRKKFTEGKSNFGMAIDVYVDSIGISHKEYMVSFEYLRKIGKEYGLELKEVIPFSELWEEGKNYDNINISNNINTMSDMEKQFSFLFSGFIFKKIKNAPNSTYKKIIKKLKKRKQK